MPAAPTLLCARERLAAVFVTHREALKRVARKLLGDAQSADDLVQDAYLKLLEATDDIAVQDVDAVREPLGYAHRMVRNLAIDRLRRGALESRLFDEDGTGDAAGFPGAETPEALAIERQQLTLLAQALAELPERVRRVFELVRLEGRTQREIAEQLGLSPTRVHGLLQDALEHCRRALVHGA